MIGEQYLGMTLDEILGEMTLDDVKYAILHEKNMTALEEKLHSEENLEEIAKQALISAVEFYDGDWAGIIEGDLAFEAWCPVLWYDRKTQGMTETHFREIEETRKLDRWIKALHECEPVSISDTSIYKEQNPVEYEIYERCHAKSLIAVPFWENPVGFLIVRNPKRFLDRSSFLQALAYVVFSTVSEKKLLERTKMAFSPESIKTDKDVIINLFGDFEIYTSKGHLNQMEINSPMLCRVIAYYLLNNNRPASSTQVYEAVKGGEVNLESAGNFMKSLITRMKNKISLILDIPLFVSSSLGYRLNPDLNIMTDVKMFDTYWMEAKGTVTTQTKIELYDRALDLYRGDLFPIGNAEEPYKQYYLHYKYKCLGMYTEIMQSYYETCNYASVMHYANRALKMEAANVDAYYWMIRSIHKQGHSVLIQGELLKAKTYLAEDEYLLLSERLEKLHE